jgi:hypothetical protein
MIFDKKTWIQIICFLGSLICIIDPLLIYFLGNQYVGYSQIGGTLSALGKTKSPVGTLFSVWWVIIGFVFILFGVGFGSVFKEKGKYARIAAWLIAIYGFGEGLGSGLFRADYINDVMTTSAMIHDTLGGFGVTAMLVLPLILLKLFSKEQYPAFFILSWGIFAFGILTTILFLFRFGDDNILSKYKGLWQRLSLLNYYVYFMAIAYLMWKTQNKNRTKSEISNS